jgi:molecular chaperone HtpG
MSTQEKTMGFQTEVSQLLKLVTHSLYSNREIFLRELISNASDALDKLRFLALTDGSLYDNDPSLAIQIDFDEKQKTLTISDNGIGMTYQEVIDNIGTIAKSGTREFIANMTGDALKDSQLIGQFGVGFYSAFIVADSVTVRTRKAGTPESEGVVWTSKGEGEFTIGNESKSTRGTDITLHMKEDATEFLSDWQLRSILTKYSDHIAWPISMKKAPEMDENGVEKPSETVDYEKVNKATASWTKQKGELSDEDYANLYKTITHDYQEPLIWSHNHVEGKQEYISLLFIPKHAPFDLWQQESKHGLKLYVKRVFIMDEAASFLPRYLRFVKGIIDAADLPLNVSREILQDNKTVDSIRAASTKRVLTMLEKLSETDKEKYALFWKEFGNVIKEGPIEDYANRETVAKLLRFSSTKLDTSEQSVSLADYISRMQPEQDKIYYLTATSYNVAKNSPHLEMFRKKDIEVLLLTDKIDEWLVGYLSEFEGKKLQSVNKGNIDLGDMPNEAEKEKETSLTPMIEQIQKVLGDKVKSVKVTHLLTDSPARIVADENDMGFEMQRILKSAGQAVPDVKPIFEINPLHPMIEQLHGVQDDTLFEKWIDVLFQQAILAEGGQLENPAMFVGLVNQLLMSK